MKPPKAFVYFAYLISKNTKQFIGFTEATHPNQAKKRMIKLWRKTIRNLEERLAKGEIELMVYRGRQSPHYYGRSRD